MVALQKLTHYSHAVLNFKHLTYHLKEITGSTASNLHYKLYQFNVCRNGEIQKNELLEEINSNTTKRVCFVCRLHSFNSLMAFWKFLFK